MRVILIPMKANQRMIEHGAEGRIAIQTIAGRICLYLQGRKIDLSAGRLPAPQCGQHHDVESPEESVFPPTIAWPAEGATGTARHDRSARETFPGDNSRFR